MTSSQANNLNEMKELATLDCFIQLDGIIDRLIEEVGNEIIDQWLCDKYQISNNKLQSYKQGSQYNSLFKELIMQMSCCEETNEYILQEFIIELKRFTYRKEFFRYLQENEYFDY